MAIIEKMTISNFNLSMAEKLISKLVIKLASPITSCFVRFFCKEIYYSKFAKDHFFLVKYFCILRKLHKYLFVS